MKKIIMSVVVTGLLASMTLVACTVKTGLAVGDVSVNSTDAVNGSQLFETNQTIADTAGLLAKGFNISVGSCFDDGDPEAEELSSMPMRECTEPHENEVYFLYDLPDGELPDDEPMYEKCGEEFDKFVGIAYDDSIYDYSIMAPNQYTWEYGHREVLCYIYDSEYEKLDKSLKNSKE